MSEKKPRYLRVKVLSFAADCAVPRRSRSSRSAAKHWWSEDLDELKLRSINAHNIWKDAGRPRNRPFFDVYKKEKYSYKLRSGMPSSR